MGSDSLVHHGDFYVDEEFDKSKKGPIELVIGTDRYFRFMDFFYLPRPPSSLTNAQVLALCDLRLKYHDLVVDHSYNRSVISLMVDQIRHDLPTSRGTPFIMDFGCGNGSSMMSFHTSFPSSRIIGVDASKLAVKLASLHGLDVKLLDRGGKLPFETNAFDGVFSAFVFHFQMRPKVYQEVGRVLKSNMRLVFNAYVGDLATIRDRLHLASLDLVDVLPIENRKSKWRLYVGRKTRGK